MNTRLLLKIFFLVIIIGLVYFYYSKNKEEIVTDNLEGEIYTENQNNEDASLGQKEEKANVISKEFRWSECSIENGLMVFNGVLTEVPGEFCENNEEFEKNKSGFLYKGSTKAYYLWKVAGDFMVKEIEGIDVSTLEIVKEYFYGYNDAYTVKVLKTNKGYLRLESLPTIDHDFAITISEIDIGDPDSLEIIDQSYMKDSKKVFFEVKEIQDADPKTFELIEAARYSRDEKSLFYEDKKVLNISGDDLVFIPNPYTWGNLIVINGDSLTMVTIPRKQKIDEPFRSVNIVAEIPGIDVYDAKSFLYSCNEENDLLVSYFFEDSSKNVLSNKLNIISASENPDNCYGNKIMP